MNVGDYIRHLRTGQKMSQEELGSKLGVKRAAVQKWECGRVQNLKRDTILKLSELFSVSPSSFIDISSESSSEQMKYSSVETNIIQTIRTLNSLGVQKTLEYIDDLKENPKYTINSDSDHISDDIINELKQVTTAPMSDTIKQK